MPGIVSDERKKQRDTIRIPCMRASTEVAKGGLENEGLGKSGHGLTVYGSIIHNFVDLSKAL